MTLQYRSGVYAPEWRSPIQRAPVRQGDVARKPVAQLRERHGKLTAQNR